MAVGAGVAVLAIRKRMSSGAGENRWLAVTVNRGPDEVTAEGGLPEPLRRLGDRVEIKIRPAAGTKGTEIMARLREMQERTSRTRWDVRPSAHWPMIEIRVSDVPASAGETSLLAVLVMALVAAGARAVRAGDPGPLVRQELLRMACFRAARDGLTGQALDVRSAQLTTPAQQLSSLLSSRSWRSSAMSSGSRSC